MSAQNYPSILSDTMIGAWQKLYSYANDTGQDPVEEFVVDAVDATAYKEAVDALSAVGGATYDENPDKSLSVTLEFEEEVTPEEEEDEVVVTSTVKDHGFAQGSQHRDVPRDTLRRRRRGTEPRRRE